jgi:hypothetical protein
MVIPESVPVTGSAPAHGWRAGDWWSAAFRVLLLLVLVAGAATIMASLRPAERQESDLTADLAAGRVTYLEYDRSDRRVRWTDGWQWRVATLVSGSDNGQRSPDVEAQTDPALEWLYQQVDASGHPVPVRLGADRQPRWWPFRVVWEPLQAATVVAWVGTFLIMLSSSRHRYANRWAWLWLFTIGQAGALLYLILEPQPIWRPRSWPRTERAPTGGGVGFVWAFLLSFVVSLAALGIADI